MENLHPTYYALYQSGYSILGIDESIERLLEDAQTWLRTPPRLDDLGWLLTLRDVTDLSALSSPHGEIEGQLYIRRATPALVAKVLDDGNASYFTRDDGVLDAA